MAAISENLAPLADRYAAAGLPLPRVTSIAGAKVPQPYRRLLVHRRDMSSTLERFHGGPIRVRPLSRSRVGDLYRREVVLKTIESGKPVEFGAISIHLDALPPAARRLVLAAKQPLGEILHRCRVAYTSRPTAFFRIRADATIRRALGMKRSATLYGRCNRMRDGRGRPIAEIVEILPVEFNTKTQRPQRQS